MYMTEHRPQYFENYVIDESKNGTYSNLTPNQKDVVASLLVTAVTEFPNQNPCKLINEATGISNIAIATGLSSLIMLEGIIEKGTLKFEHTQAKTG